MNTTRNKGEDLILAMKEKYLKLILCGRKKAEIRRTTPKEGPNKRLWLYCKGHIHGYVEVRQRYYIGTNEAYDWTAVKLHAPANVSCLSDKELEDYLKSAKHVSVFMLNTAHRLNEPCAVDIRPQSWMYMPDSLLKKLCGKYNIKLDKR